MRIAEICSLSPIGNPARAFRVVFLSRWGTVTGCSRLRLKLPAARVYRLA